MTAEHEWIESVLIGMRREKRLRFWLPILERAITWTMCSFGVALGLGVAGMILKAIKLAIF